MNFFGHAVVARWRSDEHAFLLGAMLPDLTAMLGLRLAHVGEPRVQAGVDYHHATDAAFHASDYFVRLCGQSVEQLTARGVERGTARAVAHVGFELILDGLLSRETDAVTAYTNALTYAVDNRLSESLDWAPEPRARMHAGLLRLVRAPIPQGYREPDFVADRLQVILARRPRLAIKPTDMPHVSSHVRTLHGDIAGIAPELLAQMRARLSG